MKNIRIGKDIRLNWSIMTNGQPQILEGRDLRLEITNPIGSRSVLEFTSMGNSLSATFKGIDHKILGSYKLTLWENYGKYGQTAVDKCDAFYLVASTCNESGTDGHGLATETVNLGSGDLTLNPVYGIYSKDINRIEVMSQQEYDDLPVKDGKTLYIIK